MWDNGGKMKKAKRREASLGGAFRLVDSINEYARQRSSLLAALQE